MKKLFIVALSSCLLSTLVGCGLSNQASAPSKAITNLEKKEILFQASQMVMSLEDMMPTTLIRNKTNAVAIDDSEKKTIESLLFQFDSLFNSESSFVTTIKESDKAEYATLVEVNYSSPMDESTSFSVYFNETVIDEKEDSSQDDDEDEKEDEKLDEEQESKTASSLKGLLIKDEEQYSLLARKEMETEEEEGKTETEYKLVVSLKNEAGLLIHAEEKKEVEENETTDFFSYKVIDTSLANKIVSQYSIEKEVEDGARELELITLTNRYKIEEEVKGEETFYKVRLKEDDDRGDELVYKKVITTLETGENQVSYVEVTQ
jgi:hypothetical protein